MNLPKIVHPRFDTTTPSGKKVSYRPFTGREQKVLLIAKESDDPSDIMKSVMSVLGECCDGADVRELPVFDLEYLFLCVRAKSVGNKVDIEIVEDGVRCPATVDLDSVRVYGKTDKKRTVEVSPGVHLSLKFPSAREVAEAGSGADEWDYLAMSVDSVTSGEEVTTSSEVTREEMREWLKSVPLSSIEPIRKFFEEKPRVEVDAVFTKPDGTKGTRTLTNIGDFFG